MLEKENLALGTCSQNPEKPRAKINWRWKIDIVHMHLDFREQVIIVTLTIL